MAENYARIFQNTMQHLRDLRGIYECYSDSDFVDDLSEDYDEIKTKIMINLQNSMDEILRGTVYASLNRAVKLAQKNDIEEINKLFSSEEFFSFFLICFYEEQQDEIKNYIIESKKVPPLDEEDLIVPNP